MGFKVDCASPSVPDHILLRSGSISCIFFWGYLSKSIISVLILTGVSMSLVSVMLNPCSTSLPQPKLSYCGFFRDPIFPIPHRPPISWKHQFLPGPVLPWIPVLNCCLFSPPEFIIVPFKLNVIKNYCILCLTWLLTKLPPGSSVIINTTSKTEQSSWKTLFWI